MKRRYMSVIFIFLCTAVLYTEDKPIITVLDFKTEEVSESEMRSVVNILSSALFNTGEFIVIDVKERDNILKELEFSLSGCTDESCMLEVGRMLAAERVVTGSIGKVGTRFICAVKMLETESGQSLTTAEGLYKDMDELVEGLSKMAWTLSGKEPPEHLAGATWTPGAEEYEKNLADFYERLRKRRIWGAVCGGVGLIVTGTTGYWLFTLYDAATQAYDDYMSFEGFDDPSIEGNMENVAEFDFLYTDYVEALEQYSSKSVLFGSIAAGGAVLTGIGVFLLLPWGKPKKPEGIAWAVIPIPTGVSFSLQLGTAEVLK